MRMTHYLEKRGGYFKSPATICRYLYITLLPHKGGINHD